MGYRLDGPVFMVGPKPMRTEFGIHQRLESCDGHQNLQIAKLARNVGQKRQHHKVNTLNMQMEVEVKQNIFPITRGEKL